MPVLISKKSIVGTYQTVSVAYQGMTATNTKAATETFTITYQAVSITSTKTAMEN